MTPARFTYQGRSWDRPDASHSRSRSAHYAVWASDPLAEALQPLDMDRAPVPKWASVLMWSTIGIGAGGVLYMLVRYFV